MNRSGFWREVSCKALRWMALFGVVFALGVGQATAQTVAVEGGTLTTLAEGGALVPVTAVLTVPGGTEAQTPASRSR